MMFLDIVVQAAGELGVPDSQIQNIECQAYEFVQCPGGNSYELMIVGPRFGDKIALNAKAVAIAPVPDSGDTMSKLPFGLVMKGADGDDADFYDDQEEIYLKARDDDSIAFSDPDSGLEPEMEGLEPEMEGCIPVSYTHLTLPTKRIV